jgi:hypothetical protein
MAGRLDAALVFRIRRHMATAGTSPTGDIVTQDGRGVHIANPDRERSPHCAARAPDRRRLPFPDIVGVHRHVSKVLPADIAMGSGTDKFPSCAAYRKACAVRRNWNHPFRITTVVRMRILLLRPSHLHLTLCDAASRNPYRGRWLEVLLLGANLLSSVKAYQGEFDLGARSPFRDTPNEDTPNEEGRECLIAGSLQ